MTAITVRGRPKRTRTRVGNSTRSAYGTRRRVAAATKIQRFVRSKLRTRTATALNQKIKTSKDGPVSDSWFNPKIKGFKLGKIKKLTSPQFYVTNGALRQTWVSGQQSVVGSYASLSNYNVADILAMKTQVTNATNIGGAFNTTASSTMKLYMKKCFQELLITNQTNDVVHMTIYDIVTRRDIVNGNYNDPNVAWYTGLQDAGVSTAMQTTPGSTPFQVPGFTEFYKVEKITEVDLHSGGHHRHKSVIKHNREFNMEIPTELNNNALPIGKWTRFSMVVCHGYPDNASGGSNVTTASGAIDIVIRKQYEFYLVQQNRTFNAYVNNLPTIGAEAIINDLTGSVTVVSSA